MLFWNTVKVALRSLLANKLRSFLSMLGIIIGVGAVIAMLALGAGAQKKVLGEITAMGVDLLSVRAGQGFRGGVRGGSVQNLTLEDAEALVNEVPAVKMVAPVVRGNAQFKYMNQNCQSSVYGSTTTYFPVRNYEVGRGRCFSSGEIDRRARVAVLGADTVEQLFGAEDPLDKDVKIDGITFTVVGVLKPKGAAGFFNPDDVAIIPYSTAMKRLLGVDHLDEINVQIDHDADQEKVQAEVEEVLRKRHAIRPGQDDDFHVRNMAEMVEAATTMTNTFTVLLGSVAAISLVVGGIGIMNIMLVTVTERTREIGIRKAIGAKDRDVLVQFLLEAVLMSSLGGI
ncbi:MAG TPA: FtsX-like permease family protein, partial [Candidatus Hydrogenedentes bacterium]|nr:FtsX-like permease family protein [Candidatus Hydrogenedentota bacterium]